MKTETRPHIKCIRHARLSATEKADEAMLLFGGKKLKICVLDSWQRCSQAVVGKKVKEGTGKMSGPDPAVLS